MARDHLVFIMTWHHVFNGGGGGEDITLFLFNGGSRGMAFCFFKMMVV